MSDSLSADYDALTIEWGIECEGVFSPLDFDVAMTRETAESALGEALDCGADPALTFVVTRRVTPWVRVFPSESGVTLTDLPEPSGKHCAFCGWSSGQHDPRSLMCVTASDKPGEDSA